jgi:hypothetical protein
LRPRVPQILIFKYGEISTTIGRGSLKFLEHSYLCIIYIKIKVVLYKYSHACGREEERRKSKKEAKLRQERGRV